MKDFDLRKYIAEGKLLKEDKKQQIPYSRSLTESEEKIMDKFEDLMNQGLSTVAQLKNEPPSKEEVNEVIGITLATLALGAPGLLKVAGKLSQVVGWLFGVNKGDGNVFSRWFKKLSTSLHHKYIAGIALGLKSAYPERYKNKSDKVAKRDASTIYAGMLAAAMIATGIGAAHAASQVVQTLEIAHIGIDAADIVAIAGELASEVK